MINSRHAKRVTKWHPTKEESNCDALPAAMQIIQFRTQRITHTHAPVAPRERLIPLGDRKREQTAAHDRSHALIAQRAAEQTRCVAARMTGGGRYAQLAVIVGAEREDLRMRKAAGERRG